MIVCERSACCASSSNRPNKVNYILFSDGVWSNRRWRNGGGGSTFLFLCFFLRTKVRARRLSDVYRRHFCVRLVCFCLDGRGYRCVYIQKRRDGIICNRFCLSASLQCYCCSVIEWRREAEQEKEREQYIPFSLSLSPSAFFLLALHMWVSFVHH